MLFGILASRDFEVVWISNLSVVGMRGGCFFGYASRAICWICAFLLAMVGID